MINRVREMLEFKIGEVFKIPKYSPYNFYFEEDRLVKDCDGFKETADFALGHIIRHPELIERLPFKPKYGEAYFSYSRSTKGIIVVDAYAWEGLASDYCRYKAGACFRSFNEAMEHLQEFRESINEYDSCK